MLFTCFFKSYCQTSYIVNVAVNQGESCEISCIEDCQLNIIEVFPNPVNTQLTINNFEENEDVIEVSIYNLIGEKISVYSFLSEAVSIDVSNIQNGIYLLHIKTLLRVYNHKILINHN